MIKDIFVNHLLDKEDVTAAPAAEHPLKVDPDQGLLGPIVPI